MPLIHKVLLTVPNLESTASPWREAMGLARHLPTDRFQLTICALRPDGAAESIPFLEAVGVKAFVARFRPRGRSLRRLFESFRDGRKIREYGPFDLQHSMDFTSSPYEAIMSRRHARTFIFSQRNMNENGHPTLLRLKSKIARRIICVSESVRQLMQGMSAGAKLVKIYPGIELDRIPWRPQCSLENPLEHKPFKLLMVGHVEQRKRIEDGIAAVVQLACELPLLHLDVAGRMVDSKYLEKLKALIQNSGVQDRISFLGPRTDIFDLMGKYDALLHCAESEAFGMRIAD